MKITKIHVMGVIVAIIILLIDLVFMLKHKAFTFILGIAFVIGAIPFLITVTTEVGKEKEREDMFLEFSRNLVESVKSGTPISRSIINVKDKDYGSLSRHVQKLANQIAIGIPVKQAFAIFSADIDNRVITRSIALISEAEQSGGQIDTILESVARSVNEIEDVKKEQTAAVSNIVMQGYIIFIIFIIIMLITEIKILPMTTGISGSSGVGSLMGGGGSSIGGGGGTATPEEMATPFLIMLVVQGLFAGLVIGRLSEENIKAGIKHSFILMMLALLITTGARLIFSGKAATPTP